jgi:hypothetical protein
VSYGPVQRRRSAPQDLRCRPRVAEQLLGRTVLETHRGPEHPYTARSLNNLGEVLRAQGDLTTARLLHQRALAIHEARLGAEHPDTVRTRRNLAAVAAALDEQQ